MSNRQILVNGRPAAIQGLDEVMSDLYERGRRPDDPDVGLELVGMVREKDTYIPRPAVQDFAQALAREYRRYADLRRDGHVLRPVDYGTWQGHPREQIPWFPTVADDLCNGCGACLDFCSFGVYGKVQDGKVQVVEPFRCQVGCDMCASICKPRAITFPPRTMLDAFRPGR